MKKPRFKESAIFKILKETESGTPVSELCRTYGMSSTNLYKWRSNYKGMDVSG